MRAVKDVGKCQVSVFSLTKALLPLRNPAQWAAPERHSFFGQYTNITLRSGQPWSGGSRPLAGVQYPKAQVPSRMQPPLKTPLPRSWGVICPEQHQWPYLFGLLGQALSEAHLASALGIARPLTFPVAPSLLLCFLMHQHPTSHLPLACLSLLASPRMQPLTTGTVDPGSLRWSATPSWKHLLQMGHR